MPKKAKTGISISRSDNCLSSATDKSKEREGSSALQEMKD
jgi:hypothetical protein